MNDPQCPHNYIIINLSSIWIFFFVKSFRIPSRVRKYAQFGAFTLCTRHRWSKSKEQTPQNIFPLTENKEVQFKEPHLALWIFLGIAQ